LSKKNVLTEGRIKDAQKGNMVSGNKKKPIMPPPAPKPIREKADWKPENNYFSMRKIQREQGPWVKHNFGNRPAWMPLVGMMEELGELAHAFLKKSQKIRKQDYDAKMKDAIGDIVIFMSDFANSQNFDIEEIVQATWDEVSQRDWKKFPQNGLTE
jgi:NTP pyrophosphatase (non-canonical NTP hydrolase)